MKAATESLRVIDSHTGGEPTRVVISGWPNTGEGSVVEQLERCRTEFDRYRAAVVQEPRGSDVLVGALLLEPVTAGAVAGVIFFNNVGYLGMCGHGTIGLIATLAHLGHIQPGTHSLDTAVGVVQATLHEDGTVSVRNVPSYRKVKSAKIEVPGIGAVYGDIAWGGNWFFLTEQTPCALEVANVEALTEFSWKLRQAVNAQGYPEVDHVELVGPAVAPDANARNFMLCPGKAYDRSPCGTGTSAKLACLAADGKLKPGEKWIQESIIGSRFEGSYEERDGEIIPIITGSAFVTADVQLLLQPNDPFCWGIR